MKKLILVLVLAVALSACGSNSGSQVVEQPTPPTSNGQYGDLVTTKVKSYNAPILVTEDNTQIELISEIPVVAVVGEEIRISYIRNADGTPAGNMVVVRSNNWLSLGKL